MLELRNVILSSKKEAGIHGALRRHVNVPTEKLYPPEQNSLGVGPIAVLKKTLWKKQKRKDGRAGRTSLQKKSQRGVQKRKIGGGNPMTLETEPAGYSLLPIREKTRENLELRSSI